MTGQQLSQSSTRPLRLGSLGRGWTRRWKKPLAGFAAGSFAAVAVLLGPPAEARAVEGASHVSVAPGAVPSAKPVTHPRDKTYYKRRWGVEVMFVRQAAAGYMLEFRYRVLDADKAKPLFERKTKPMLTHAETGAKLIVPTPAKTGALRNSDPPIAGRTYWMFFANPGKMVKPGQHVSVEIGEFRVDGLVVR